MVSSVRTPLYSVRTAPYSAKTALYSAKTALYSARTALYGLTPLQGAPRVVADEMFLTVACPSR